MAKSWPRADFYGRERLADNLFANSVMAAGGHARLAGLGSKLGDYVVANALL